METIQLVLIVLSPVSKNLDNNSLETYAIKQALRQMMPIIVAVLIVAFFIR